MQTNNQQATDLMAEWQASREVATAAFQMVFPRQLKEVLPLEEFLPSPINMPEVKSGGISVAHRVVEGSTPIINRREAFMRGLRPTILSLPEQLRCHELRDARAGVWMTDLPCELHQVAGMVHTAHPRGRVLVGGLGLGVLAHFLARRAGVGEITIVERSPHVIKLVKPHLPPSKKISVVRNDINRFPLSRRKPYDYYLLDTWQGTSESTWWGEVFPLKRAIRHRCGTAPTIHCWAEDIMAGQVLEKLASSRRNWHYEKLPPSMSAEEAAFFFARVGEPAWEEKYGKLVGGKL